MPDAAHPGMWRVRWPDGRLSDMTNLTRAKDAVACFMETEERRRRGRHSPSEGRLCVKTDAGMHGASSEPAQMPVHKGSMTAAKLYPQLENDPKDRAVEVADPYDLSNLRLDQSFVESAGVKRLLTSVPVRKPNPQDFIRAHPGPEYRAALAIIELRDDRETYLVMPSVARDLPGEFVMANVYTAINRQGVVQLWPVRLPAVDGRVLEWHRSAAEAAELAMQKWVRVKANMSLGAYEIFEATSTIPDPEWPEQSFQDLLRIAFRDRLIDSLGHPVIKRLRGS